MAYAATKMCKVLIWTIIPLLSITFVAPLFAQDNQKGFSIGMTIYYTSSMELKKATIDEITVFQQIALTTSEGISDDDKNAYHIQLLDSTGKTVAAHNTYLPFIERVSYDSVKNGRYIGINLPYSPEAVRAVLKKGSKVLDARDIGKPKVVDNTATANETDEAATADNVTVLNAAPDKKYTATSSDGVLEINFPKGSFKEGVNIFVEKTDQNLGYESKEYSTAAGSYLVRAVNNSGEEVRGLEKPAKVSFKVGLEMTRARDLELTVVRSTLENSDANFLETSERGDKVTAQITELGSYAVAQKKVPVKSYWENVKENPLSYVAIFLGVFAIGTVFVYLLRKRHGRAQQS